MKLVTALVLCYGVSGIGWNPATSAAQAVHPQSTTQAAQAPTSLDAYIAYACHHKTGRSATQSDEKFAACVRQQSEAFNAYSKSQAQLADLPAATASKVRADCKVDAALADSSTASTAAACVTSRVAALKAADAFSAQMAMASAFVAPPPPLPAQPQAKASSTAASSKSKADLDQTTFKAGEHLGTSAFRTRSTCFQSKPKGSDAYVTSSPEVIGVRRSLMDPEEASDGYGRRLGKRYIIYQVRVSNFSKDFQYVVHDISLNLRDLPTTLESSSRNNGEPSKESGPETRKSLPLEEFQASTRDLDFLRGVAEKGQDHDPRNATLHTLQGINSVAAGISGLTPFSDVMGSAVSVFGGPFIQAFVALAPDHTATQLNRLSDQAFASNTLVDKLHTRVYAVFIPDSAVLDKDAQRSYWKDPRKELDKHHLDLVDVCVDGSLVTETNVATAPDFSLSTGNVAPNSSLTLSDTDAGAAIYYTTDGSPVSANSTKYTAPIVLPAVLGQTITVQALAVAPNEQQSPVVNQVYTIAPVAPAPVITPAATPAAGGSFAVTISYGSPQVSGSIYYTTDGSDPSTSSLLYSGPIQVTAPETIKAIATGPAFSTGPVAQVDYK